MKPEVAVAITVFPSPTTSPIKTPFRFFKWRAAILTAAD